MVNTVVVTGVGPRTGTSYIMQQALLSGLPILGEKFIDGYTISEFNNNGYYDLHPEKLNEYDYNNKIIKSWYPFLSLFDSNDFSNILVLERKDKEKQQESILKVYKEEVKLQKLSGVLSKINPYNFIPVYEEGLNDWLKNKNKDKILRVYTEDIDSNLKNILTFLRRGLLCH